MSQFGRSREITFQNAVGIKCDQSIQLSEAVPQEFSARIILVTNAKTVYKLLHKSKYKTQVRDEYKASNYP